MAETVINSTTTNIEGSFEFKTTLNTNARYKLNVSSPCEEVTIDLPQEKHEYMIQTIYLRKLNPQEGTLTLKTVGKIFSKILGLNQKQIIRVEYVKQRSRLFMGKS